MKNKNKIKLTYSYFYESDNLSVATIQTPKGIFTGHSRLNPVDKDVRSRFVGCRCAELKAIIKYLKACRNELSAQIKVMEDFHKNLNTSKRFIVGGYIDKRLKKEISILRGKRDKIICTIEDITGEITEAADNVRKAKELFTIKETKKNNGQA